MLWYVQSYLVQEQPDPGLLSSYGLLCNAIFFIALLF